MSTKHTVIGTNGTNGTKDSNGANGSDGATEHTTPTAATSPVANAPIQASTLAARVLQAVAYLKMSHDVLALDAPALSDADRRRLAKQRRGGETHLPLIAQLATEWNVSLRTQPTSAMADAAATVSALQPLVVAFRGFQQEVDDINAVANGEAWSTASALYSVLKRMSKKDPKLAAQLEPVTQFFKFRRQPAKELTPGKAEKRKAKALAKAKALVDANQEKVGAAQETPVVQLGNGGNGVSGIGAGNGVSAGNGLNGASTGGAAH